MFERSGIAWELHHLEKARMEPLLFQSGTVKLDECIDLLVSKIHRSKICMSTLKDAGAILVSALDSVVSISESADTECDRDSLSSLAG